MSGTPKHIPSDQPSRDYVRKQMAEQARRDSQPVRTGERPQFDGHADCNGRGCRECTG